MSRRRDVEVAQVAAVTEQLDGLLDELAATMAALNELLAARPPGAEEMSPL